MAESPHSWHFVENDDRKEPESGGEEQKYLSESSVDTTNDSENEHLMKASLPGVFAVDAHRPMELHDTMPALTQEEDVSQHSSENHTTEAIRLDDVHENQHDAQSDLNGRKKVRRLRRRLRAFRRATQMSDEDLDNWFTLAFLGFIIVALLAWGLGAVFKGTVDQSSSVLLVNPPVPPVVPFPHTQEQGEEQLNMDGRIEKLEIEAVRTAQRLDVQSVQLSLLEARVASLESILVDRNKADSINDNQLDAEANGRKAIDSITQLYIRGPSDIMSASDGSIMCDSTTVDASTMAVLVEENDEEEDNDAMDERRARKKEWKHRRHHGRRGFKANVLEDMDNLLDRMDRLESDLDAVHSYVTVYAENVEKELAALADGVSRCSAIDDDDFVDFRC